MKSKGEDIQARIKTDEPGSYVEKLGFKGTIDQNDRALESYSQMTGLSQQFHEYKHELADAIKAGKITLDTMSNEWVLSVIKGSIESSYVQFKHACIYSVLSEIAFGKSETEKAWSLLAKSCTLCGSANASKENKSTQDHAKQLENVRKGGKKRGDGYLPVRQEVVRLLNSPPKGGWNESLPTRKAIAESLKDFKKSKESTQKAFLFPANISVSLCRWFTDCPEILKAYKKNTAAALSEQLSHASSSCDLSE